MNPGRNFDENKSFVHSTDLLENTLYLTEILTSSLSSIKKLQSSTLSLDSIEKDHDQFDLFLYDSLNDESDDDHQEQFYDCSNDTNLFQTIANERRVIERLTRRCHSVDSLDNYETILSSSRKVLSMIYAWIEIVSVCLMCAGMNIFFFDFKSFAFYRTCQQWSNYFSGAFNDASV